VPTPKEYAREHARMSRPTGVACLAIAANSGTRPAALGACSGMSRIGLALTGQAMIAQARPAAFNPTFTF
jgi:hypothetical protein